VPHVTAEKGCIAYVPAVDVESGIPVRWTCGGGRHSGRGLGDLDDLRAHLKTAHMQAYREKVKIS